MESVKVPARVLIGIRQQVAPSEMSDFFKTCYGKIHQVLSQIKVIIARFQINILI
jgi:hypothetical protein